MDIRIVNKGQTFQQITERLASETRRATKAAGREVADVGTDAIESKAPSWDGRRLGVHTTMHGSGDGATVEFRGTPAGPWSILESGARPHIEKPHKQALKFAGRYAALVQHPGQRGQQRWTKATKNIERAVVPAVERVYVQALT